MDLEQAIARIRDGRGISSIRSGQLGARIRDGAASALTRTGTLAMRLRDELGKLNWR